MNETRIINLDTAL